MFSIRKLVVSAFAATAATAAFLLSTGTVTVLAEDHGWDSPGVDTIQVADHGWDSPLPKP